MDYNQLIQMLMGGGTAQPMGAMMPPAPAGVRFGPPSQNVEVYENLPGAKGDFKGYVNQGGGGQQVPGGILDMLKMSVQPFGLIKAAQNGGTIGAAMNGNMGLLPMIMGQGNGMPGPAGGLATNAIPPDLIKKFVHKIFGG